MMTIDKKSECCGCGACRSICPVNAITMYPDEEGFLYPQIDTERCIGCGKCDQVCPVKNEQDELQHPITAYAARTKNRSARQTASSGGVFAEIAAHVLERGGIVFGAAFDERCHVRHISVDRVADLGALKGSKYVQSEIGTAYTDAKRYLDTGKTVLFTGTPCQIGGLYRYLGKPYDNLITQDIVCHGVPSPSIWDTYVQLRETKAASKARAVSFRNKHYGWKDYAMQFEFENGKTYRKRAQNDPYMRSYLRNLSIRPSCFDCAFKSKHRSADITLADLWGVEHVCPALDDDTGVSLVLLHSDKARELYETIRASLDDQTVDVDQAIPYNRSMIVSTTPNDHRAAFFTRIRTDGFDGIRPYIRDSWMRRIKRAVKILLRR